MGDIKSTDFANPMYEELENNRPEDSVKKLTNDTISSNAGLYEVPDDLYNKKVPIDVTNNYDKNLSGSAVLPPSSVIHRSSPTVQIRQVALNPTSVDTDKDTQFLVEEDKSEC